MVSITVELLVKLLISPLLFTFVATTYLTLLRVRGSSEMIGIHTLKWLTIANYSHTL